MIGTDRRVLCVVAPRAIRGALVLCMTCVASLARAWCSDYDDALAFVFVAVLVVTVVAIVVVTSQRFASAVAVAAVTTVVAVAVTGVTVLVVAVVVVVVIIDLFPPFVCGTDGVAACVGGYYFKKLNPLGTKVPKGFNFLK